MTIICSQCYKKIGAQDKTVLNHYAIHHPEALPNNKVLKVNKG